MVNCPFACSESSKKKKRQKFDELAIEGRETLQKNRIIKPRCIFCGNSDWIVVAFLWATRILTRSHRSSSNLDFVFTVWSELGSSSIVFSLWSVHLVSFSLCHSNGPALCSGLARLVMTFNLKTTFTSLQARAACLITPRAKRR